MLDLIAHYSLSTSIAWTWMPASESWHKGYNALARWP